jgi:hypothetical protein
MMAVLFVIVGGALLVAAVLALVSVGRFALGGSAGLLGDGLGPGSRAPRWSGTDQRGRRWSVPSGERWQLLLFADHSLGAFPELLPALDGPGDDPDDPEIVVLARAATAGKAVAAMPRLGLELPVVGVPERLYGRYNVRVMPWAMFVDPTGIVWGSSLVNRSWKVEKLGVIARARAAEHRRPAQARAGAAGLAP